MLLPIAYEGEGRDGYRDQIVTCDVGVSLNSKTHPLFMKYSNGTSTQCYAYHMSLFNSKNFSFTCVTKNIHIGFFPCFRARICTAVRTGAKRGTHFVSILCT